ncbi:MAG: biopolymer transporter Tol [SAR86 cluster bacterium]|uniref:Biopolymer transporter Tol n=1 Tax=SAR86 cluster bacterium TaxID=2030880 RepID=A0A2A4MQ36_9GAMM|nr:MAG: biopolymer transporter Tol [SAR86 cluster bacterium]
MRVSKTLLVLSCLAITACNSSITGQEVDGVAAATQSAAAPIVEDNSNNESILLANTRQLITSGLRSGEGYFAPDGQSMIYQSEEVGDNPFYQIYVLDLLTGISNKVSNGIGLTSCAWIHPSQAKLIFASTHQDPRAREKMVEEIAIRESGITRPYGWDYDEAYDIFQANSDGSNLINLTQSPGYDAEGSYSADGSKILFASNREAYERSLSQAEQALFDDDKSYFMDLYIMNADGSDVRQITHSPGYDGGPFFSPDNTKVVWRRFNPDGNSAEIWTMDIDGSHQRQLTADAVVSWGPYFHPSGEYIIYSSNILGNSNFELFMIDPQGISEPVRVTSTEGTDILPVFSPDGLSISWSSTRTDDGTSQIFISEWNHEAALSLLGKR